MYHKKEIVLWIFFNNMNKDQRVLRSTRASLNKNFLLKICTSQIEAYGVVMLEQLWVTTWCRLGCLFAKRDQRLACFQVNSTGTLLIETKPVQRNRGRAFDHKDGEQLLPAASTHNSALRIRVCIRKNIDWWEYEWHYKKTRKIQFVWSSNISISSWTP